MGSEDKHDGDNYMPLAAGGGLLVLLITVVADLSAWNAEAWAVRVQIVVGYVLVLTLFAVSRNTKHTRNMVSVAQEQIGLQHRQLGPENLEFHWRFELGT